MTRNLPTSNLLYLPYLPHLPYLPYLPYLPTDARRVNAVTVRAHQQPHT